MLVIFKTRIPLFILKAMLKVYSLAFHAFGVPQNVHFLPFQIFSSFSTALDVNAFLILYYGRFFQV